MRLDERIMVNVSLTAGIIYQVLTFQVIVGEPKVLAYILKSEAYN